MKRAMSVFGILIFFGIFVTGMYYFSAGKTITRSREWAKGKISVPASGEYDVIVVGSDPEGIAAAIGAARSGAKTILLGKEDGPGGLLTYGMLNTLDMSRNSDKEILTKGVFMEFYNAIGRTESFDVELAKKTFTNMIEREKYLEYRSNSKFVEPILDGDKIIGVVVQDKDGNTAEIKGKRVIDATQDGDVCAASGVPYYVGMEDIHVSGTMAATLIIKVDGVDWKEIENDVKKYKKATASEDCGWNSSTAWGFGKWCYDKYKPIYGNMQLRGPNFGLQDDGTVLINALQIFNVDGLSEESKEKALAEGKIEAENVVKHLKKILKSFKDAYLVDVADELYIRETRHIKGEYVLKATDILENKNFSNKIALSAYPIDIQATSKTNTGYIIGSPNQYSIPLGCIVPQKIDNLLIVGRSASYSSVAAGSARVVPTGMAVGESAGITAVYTIYKDTTPRELLSSKSRIKQLTGILKNQNVYLIEFVSINPIGNVKGYKKIKKLLNLGMLSGGYSNNYNFDKEATLSTLCNALVNALQRGGNEKYELMASSRITRSYSNDKLTGGAAARVIVGFLDGEPYIDKFVRAPNWLDSEYEAKLAEYKAKVEEIEKQCWEIAKEKGYFSEEFKINDILTYRQALVIAVDTIEKYIERDLGVIY